jgi:hypothetical protein
MTRVREVREIDAGVYRWKVGGPAALLIGSAAAKTETRVHA